MGTFHVSFGSVYILLAINYMSKWVEAKATQIDDSKVVVDFVRSHIFCRFDTSRVFLVTKVPTFVIEAWRPC